MAGASNSNVNVKKEVMEEESIDSTNPPTRIFRPRDRNREQSHGESANIDQNIFNVDDENIGRNVVRVINNELQEGFVQSYNAKYKLYKVIYNSGLEEEVPKELVVNYFLVPTGEEYDEAQPVNAPRVTQAGQGYRSLRMSAASPGRQPPREQAAPELPAAPPTDLPRAPPYTSLRIRASNDPTVRESKGKRKGKGRK